MAVAGNRRISDFSVGNVLVVSYMFVLAVYCLAFISYFYAFTWSYHVSCTASLAAVADPCTLWMIKR